MVSTAKVVADKALERRAGEQCVAWAISMLEQGYSGEYLQMLASLAGHLNHFEVSALRDRAMDELSILQCTREVAIERYAAEVLREYLAGRISMRQALSEVHELCVAAGMLSSIYDFYLLHWALEDLLAMGVQHYWDGADLTSIEGIARTRAHDFLAHRGAA